MITYGQYDPFDPEELRRRRLMESLGLDSQAPVAPLEMAQQQGPQLVKSDPAPQQFRDIAPQQLDVRPDQSSLAPPQSTQDSPGQARYRQLLQEMPTREEFHRSTGRRVFDTILGGLAGAGARSPLEAAQAGEMIGHGKYQNAMSDWKTRTESALQETGIDEKQIAQRIAQQQANTAQSNEQSNAARRAQQNVVDLMKVQSTDAYRKLRGEAEVVKANKDAAGLQVLKYKLQALNDLYPENAAANDQIYKDAEMSILSGPGRMSPDEAAARTKAQTEARYEVMGRPENLKTIAAQAGARTSANLSVEGGPVGLRTAEQVAEAKARGTAAGQPTIADENIPGIAAQIARDSSLWVKLVGNDRVAAGKVRNYIAANHINVDTIPADIRSTAHWARAGQQHFTTIYSEIDSLEKRGQLGPLVSRMNNFMSGKVGAGDPEYAKLAGDTSLLKSLTARVHGGARAGGSVPLLERFDKLLNAGTMDEKTLRAGVDVIKDWIDTYAALDQGTQGPQVQAPNSGGRVSRIEVK